MHRKAAEDIQKYGFASLVSGLRKKGTVILLESQQTDHAESRFSFIAAEPVSELTVSNGISTVTRKGESQSFTENPWDVLATFQKDSGWLFGWLGYDMKNYSENLSSSCNDPLGFPDAFFMEPGLLVRYDHHTNQAERITGEWPGYNHQHIQQPISISRLVSNKTRQQYLADVEHIQHKIFEGDCYEANISHRLQATFLGDPLDLYEQMKRRGPVPFGAYIYADDRHICCASPERFLKKSGKVLRSDPIKGTIKRSEDKAVEEQQIRQELLSEKNKAENLMIVDLVRHDFSRVCEPASVQVKKLFDVQTFATLHQLVSRIEGHVMDSVSTVDIIKVCFPMGSMTGAPKINVMKFIDETEKYRRGVYSGAIGYITPEGDFDFNVVIRSALIAGEKLFYSTGGAITSGSDPQEEWEETKVKARALGDFK